MAGPKSPGLKEGLSRDAQALDRINARKTTLQCRD
jgi:hypothetical protein